MKKISEFLKGEEGATTVEYGVMIAGIAAVIISAVVSVGVKTNHAFRVLNKAMYLLHLENHR